MADPAGLCERLVLYDDLTAVTRRSLRAAPMPLRVAAPIGASRSACIDAFDEETAREAVPLAGALVFEQRVQDSIAVLTVGPSDGARLEVPVVRHEGTWRIVVADTKRPRSR